MLRQNYFFGKLFYKPATICLKINGNEQIQVIINRLSQKWSLKTLELLFGRGTFGDDFLRFSLAKKNIFGDGKNHRQSDFFHRQNNAFS